MEKKLTDKQKRFCEEYVIDWNGTRAAITAGYSKKSARQIATEMLSKPYISDYIEEIQKDLQKLCGVSAARNILELKKIAYSSMYNYKDSWMTEKEFSQISDDDKCAISAIDYTIKHTEYGEERIVKFKLYDKHKAIETLNKMLGWNATDKLDLTNSDGSLNMTPEERQKRIQAIKDKL